MNSKKFVFPPGSRNEYVSINYLLLGLIWARFTHAHLNLHLLQHSHTHLSTHSRIYSLPCRFAGAPDWDGLDMLNDLIPASVRAQSPTGYNHTHFFRRMFCSQNLGQQSPSSYQYHSLINTFTSNMIVLCSHIHLPEHILHFSATPSLTSPSISLHPYPHTRHP